MRETNKVKIRYPDRNTKQIDVTIGTLTLHFSYETVVAFQSNDGMFVSENVWSVTTGRHLNEIDGGNKADRLPYAEFRNELERTLIKHRLAD